MMTSSPSVVLNDGVAELEENERVVGGRRKRRKKIKERKRERNEMKWKKKEKKMCVNPLTIYPNNLP